MFEQPRARHLVLLHSVLGCRSTKKLRTITRYDLRAGNKLYHSIITFLHASACPAETRREEGGGGGQHALADCVMRARCTRNRNDARYCPVLCLVRSTVTKAVRGSSRSDLLTFKIRLFSFKSRIYYCRTRLVFHFRNLTSRSREGGIHF